MGKKPLDIDLKLDEIERSHTVGRPLPSGKPRPILVTYLSYRIKSKLLKGKGRLQMAGVQSKGLYINEDLTRTTLNMFHSALNMRNENYLTDCWTHDGVVFVKDRLAKVDKFTSLRKYNTWAQETKWDHPRLFAESVRAKP